MSKGLAAEIVRRVAQLSFGREFCPNCGIDLFTNPGTDVWHDAPLRLFTVQCDCGSGAIDLSERELILMGLPNIGVIHGHLP